MLGLARYGLKQGVDIAINWPGRLAVWPVMTALFMGLVEPARRCGEILLYIGVALSLISLRACTRGWDSRAAVRHNAQPEVECRDMSMDTFPDLGSLSDQELKDLIQQLTDEEQEVSYKRRILHGKIDILRAELVNRLRKKHESGDEVISCADVEKLTDILAGRAGRPRRSRRAAAMARHCPECGFVNADGAHYCSRCGVVHRPARGRSPPQGTTATYVIDEATGELRPVESTTSPRRRRAGHPLRRRPRRPGLPAARASG